MVKVTLQEQLVELLMRPVGATERARAALHLVDWLGCTLAGSVSEPFRIARKVFGESAGTRHVVGGTRASPQDAAYLNGIPGNMLEMDDVHRRAILHPGPTVMPALLACIDDQCFSELLLDSLVRGYDAVIRVGRALGPAHYAFFHNTATAGPFGAATAAGSALRLERTELVSALGNAGTVAAGLWQCRHEPVMTKQLHAAHAAQAGYLAAALAKEGFTGPKTLLDGPQGFFAALCKDGDPAAVVADADREWLIHEVSFKPWPACRHAHPVIDAVRLAKSSIVRRQIKSIAIETYRDAVTFCDWPEPRTTIEAKFSLQHAAAVAVLREQPALQDFEPSAIRDTSVAALRQRVSVGANQAFTVRYPSHFGACVRITLDGGEVVESQVDDAWGDPENPISESDIIAKVHKLMDFACVGREQRDALIAATLALPTARNCTTFLAAFAAARPTSATG